jgi:cytochrome b involved in lipid metabolism
MENQSNENQSCQQQQQEEDQSQKEARIILTIKDHDYDITDFSHPGDGINDIFINAFNGQDVTIPFSHHYSNIPTYMLEDVREKGKCHGIRYLGPSKDK